MDRDELALEQLKAKMSAEQRKNMAEIIQNELKRRESLKTGTDDMGVRLNTKKFVAKSGISGGLDSESMRDVYTDTNETIRNLRLQKIDEQLNKVRKAKGDLAKRGPAQVTRADIAAARGRRPSRFSLKQALLVFGVVALAGSKMLLSSGPSVDASVMTNGELTSAAQFAGKTDAATSRASLAPSFPQSAEQQAEVKIENAVSQPQPQRSAPAQQQPIPVIKISSTDPSEAKILTELDSRRVELERRKGQLDKREAELAAQASALNERMAELKGLVARLSDVRRERDQQADARMEQLANVYGAMDPKEAAPLISRLDSDISIPLLERLPGKRMGQILAMMDRDRAIELTKRLTAK